MKSRLRLGLPLHEDERTAASLFRDVAQDYLASIDVKLSTCQGYINILNRHWLPAIGNMLIAEVRQSHIKTVLASLSVSQKTKKNIIGPCSNVFDFAMHEGYIAANPCSTIKIGKHQRAPIERFLPAEKVKILEQLYGQALLYFTILFETGMRPGEVLALRWDDYSGDSIHVNKAIVRRRVTTTKTSETRDVIVSDALRHALNNAPGRFAGGPVLHNQSGGHCLDTDLFNPAWQVALRRARVRYRIPYTCRHTRASELLTAGIEPAFAARQMGHTTEMFFRTYAEWIDAIRGDEQRERVRKIGLRVDENCVNKLSD